MAVACEVSAGGGCSCQGDSLGFWGRASDLAVIQLENRAQHSSPLPGSGQIPRYFINCCRHWQHCSAKSMTWEGPPDMLSLCTVKDIWNSAGTHVLRPPLAFSLEKPKNASLGGRRTPTRHPWETLPGSSTDPSPG